MSKQTPTIESTHCACGNAFPVHPEGYCGGSGYAVLPSGEKICYPCADKREIEALRDRSKPFVAYVGSCGNRITTWTGGKLMDITEARRCRLSRQSFTHSDSTYFSIHAVDVHGGHWAGRGSSGIAIKLRPVKG